MVIFANFETNMANFEKIPSYTGCDFSCNCCFEEFTQENLSRDTYTYKLDHSSDGLSLTVTMISHYIMSDTTMVPYHSLQSQATVIPLHNEVEQAAKQAVNLLY